MNANDLANFKRTLEILGFENKTHLSRKEIERLVKELEMNRDYSLADYISSLDPAAIADLLRY